MKFSKHKKNGFTLIEMMVAIFVFSIVMTLATGAIFSIVSANKTSQALKSVMDNLSSALDSMSRDARYGSMYNCGAADWTFGSQNSCSENQGSDAFSFIDRKNIDTMYKFQADPDQSDGSGSIYKCINRVSIDETCIRLTSPEVHIKKLHFYVQGATKAEAQQPLLLITISGYAKAGSKDSPFNIETMVDQRNMTVCKDVIPDSIKTGVTCPIILRQW